MPIHFIDLDVVSEIQGIRSALIVPCNMCPAVTVAVRENKPFLQIMRSFLKSPPFEKYIRALQTRLKEKGVTTTVFRNPLPHQWFLCMWTTGQHKKLRQYAQQYEAIIVLGCESASLTVRDSVRSSRCRIIEGMKATGIMNAKLRFHPPCSVSFDDCKFVPFPSQKDQMQDEEI